MKKLPGIPADNRKRYNYKIKDWLKAAFNLMDAYGECNIYEITGDMYFKLTLEQADFLKIMGIKLIEVFDQKKQSQPLSIFHTTRNLSLSD